tara:strand:- start:3829 stop:4998 length:1170 start_codon:yes stop_codon:yes gene_type:complete
MAKKDSKGPQQETDPNDNTRKLREKLHERLSRAGLPPGEDLPEIPSAFDRQCHTTFDLFRFSPEELVEEQTDDPEEARNFFKNGEKYSTWIHVNGVHAVAKLRAFGELLDLHPLTIEDVMNLWARPRVDINKDELFFTGRAVDIESKSSHPKGQQVSIVLRQNLIISFSEREDDLFRSVKMRLHNSGSRIRSSGTAFLAYSLIDTLVDRLLLLTEAVEEIVVDMEESMLNEADNTDPVPIGEIYRRKRQVLRLNRLAFPLRDAIHDLHDLSPEVMDRSMGIYLRDLLDHSRRAAERVEHARGMLHDLQDFHSARQDNRINRTMQLLTVIGTIFVPLTFVAGVYGMNFDPQVSPWNMPLIDNYWGYPICLGGMVVFAAVMVGYFKRRGWL